MEIINNVLTDAFVLRPRLWEDSRGYFYESFNRHVFDEVTGHAVDFVQENQSLSSKGTLRGLHFQTGEAAQSKLVRVVKGAAYDVAVDLRPDSPTFKQWYGVELTEENHHQFFIPRGFAHGFVGLEKGTIFQYKVDNYYCHECDAGVIWNDPELDISWPELFLNLSEKDERLPQLNQLNLKHLW